MILLSSKPLKLGQKLLVTNCHLFSGCRYKFGSPLREIAGLLSSKPPKFGQMSDEQLFLERLSIVFTANHRREKWPQTHDHVAFCCSRLP